MIICRPALEYSLEFAVHRSGSRFSIVTDSNKDIAVQHVLWECCDHSLHQQTGAAVTLPGPDPDVPSEPVSLFCKDLAGDRVMFWKWKHTGIISDSKASWYLIWENWTRLTEGHRQVHGLRWCSRHLLRVDLVLPLYFDNFLFFPPFLCRQMEGVRHLSH